MSEARPNPPAPFPKREGGERSAPPSLLGKGAGGLGSYVRLAIAFAVAAFALWYFAFRELEPKNDLERFQGAWQINRDGKPTPNSVRVTGDTWEYVGGKAYRMTLDESTEPKRIVLELADMTGLIGPRPKLHGVYAFEGNRTVRVLLVPPGEPLPKTLDLDEALVLTRVSLDEVPRPKEER